MALHYFRVSLIQGPIWLTDQQVEICEERPLSVFNGNCALLVHKYFF